MWFVSRQRCYAPPLLAQVNQLGTTVLLPALSPIPNGSILLLFFYVRVQRGAHTACRLSNFGTLPHAKRSMVQGRLRCIAECQDAALGLLPLQSEVLDQAGALGVVRDLGVRGAQGKRLMAG